MPSFHNSEKRYSVVVKKTICSSSGFFYNHLYQPSVFRNLFLKSIILLNKIDHDSLKNLQEYNYRSWGQNDMAGIFCFYLALEMKGT